VEGMKQERWNMEDQHQQVSTCFYFLIASSPFLSLYFTSL
jgi:hypothetical protein